MKKFILIFYLMGISLLYSQKVALLVGVADVKGGNMLYIDSDLSIMKSFLIDEGFIVKTLSYEKATLKDVRLSFKSFYTLTKNDIFLFYYTGHGARMKGINSNENYDNFFVLNQTSFSDGNTINGGILSDNEYSLHLYKIKAKKISIIDACHSASIYKSIGTNNITKSISPKGTGNIFERGNSVENFQSMKTNNLINISATKDTEQAENSPIGSIFTIGLINTIKSNPTMTLKELERDLILEMPKIANKIGNELADSYPEYKALVGNFTPQINTMPLRLKDIQVSSIFSDNNIKPKPLLVVKTVGNKKVYKLGEVIALNIITDSKDRYLYIFKDKGEFLVKVDLDECKGDVKKYCRVRDILASKPLGDAMLQIVTNKNKLYGVTLSFKIIN